MGTIPAPNIFEDSAQIAQMPIEAQANIARLRAMGVQTQGMQQEQQERALQMEIQKRQLADQDALTKAMTQFDPAKQSLADIPKLITSNGGSGQAALNAQQGLITQRKNLMGLSDEQFQQELRKADLIQGVHDQVTQAPDELKQNVYTQGLQSLARAGVDVSQEPPQYPGDQVFAQHLPAIRMHSAILAEAEKDREQTSKEIEAGAKQTEAENQQWAKFPELGTMVNTKTGEQRNISGAAGVMSPGMMEGKYVALQQRKKSGLPIDPSDQAWMQGYEKYKTLVPAFNFSLQQGAGSNLPLNPKQQATANAILEGRLSPPGSFALKTPYWQTVMGAVMEQDPQWSEQRAQLRKDFTVGKHSTEINSINVAMGHVGVMGDAIDALNNNDVKALNRLANFVGAQVGRDNVTTFNTIVHRVGSEIAKAYLGAGGSAGERGADEKDFDPALGPQQLRSNVGITARLLRSKVSALENQWNQNKSDNMPDFQSRFITPEAQAQLDKWAPKAGANTQHTGKYYEQFSIHQ